MDLAQYRKDTTRGRYRKEKVTAFVERKWSCGRGYWKEREREVGRVKRFWARAVHLLACSGTRRPPPPPRASQPPTPLPNLAYSLLDLLSPHACHTTAASQDARESITRGLGQSEQPQQLLSLLHLCHLFLSLPLSLSLSLLLSLSFSMLSYHWLSRGRELLASNENLRAFVQVQVLI